MSSSNCSSTEAHKQMHFSFARGHWFKQTVTSGFHFNERAVFGWGEVTPIKNLSHSRDLPFQIPLIDFRHPSTTGRIDLLVAWIPPLFQQIPATKWLESLQQMAERLPYGYWGIHKAQVQNSVWPIWETLAPRRSWLLLGWKPYWNICSCVHEPSKIFSFNFKHIHELVICDILNEKPFLVGVLLSPLASQLIAVVLTAGKRISWGKKRISWANIHLVQRPKHRVTEPQPEIPPNSSNQ